MKSLFPLHFGPECGTLFRVPQSVDRPSDPLADERRSNVAAIEILRTV